MRWISIIIAALFIFGAMRSSAAEADERSVGCERLPPEIPPRSVMVAGQSRSLIASVPDDYVSANAHRLIIAFHGRTTLAERARRYYGLEDADQKRTIFVYPQALRQEDGTFVWRLPEDLALFDAIVERFASQYCIASNEIFAVGHSLGASFVNSLACARGELLRGIATVAGGISRLDCSGRTAALLLHNPDDRLVPIAEGKAVLEALLDQNGLSAKPVTRYDEPFTCQRFGTAESRNPVIWCLYDQDHLNGEQYYPHQWPDGTAEAAMHFFAALD